MRISGATRGVTPLVLQFPESDAGVVVELALERHVPVRETIALTQDQRLRFGLQPVRGPVKPTSRRHQKGDPLDGKW